MAGVRVEVVAVLLLMFCRLTQSHVLALHQPNIVLLVTDDQDAKGIIPVVKTQNLIANEGATFVNAFATTPLCCPSRSSLLTGRYLHNTQVFNNSQSGGCNGQKWQNKYEHRTFSNFLHDHGYTTFYAGKYLNQYGYKHAGGMKRVPPGWDWWMGLKGNSRYYNYSLSINGTAKYFENEYLTDVISNYASDFLRMQSRNSSPFLLVVAPPAPHSPFTPANRHKNHFKNESVPRTPNFNVGVQTDKHWLLRMPPSPLPHSLISLIDEYWRLRWCSLLAVDDLLENLVLAIRRLGQLDNTYFIVTSDHGYHLGHYGLPWDKRQPYDTDIRVPLLVRGPQVPKKILIRNPVLLIDIAPTLIEMSGFRNPYNMDGKSFFSLLRQSKRRNRAQKFSRTFLVEYRGEGNGKSVDQQCAWQKDDSLSNCELKSACKCQDSRNNTYDCLRSISDNTDFQFCAFKDNEGFMEAYDVRKDPYQLSNIAYKMKKNSTLKYMLALSKLQNCRGASCRITFKKHKR